VTDIPATGPALADASPAPGGRSDDRILLILELLVPATDADKGATSPPDPEFW
jgi:hypothetical protein